MGVVLVLPALPPLPEPPFGESSPSITAVPPQATKHPSAAPIQPHFMRVA
jgi:hypothetical protein